MKRIQFTVISAALLLSSCKEHPKNTNPLGEPDIIAVKVSPVSSFRVPTSVQVSGLVSTEDQANYSFKIGGVISRILVNEGDFFRKGQLLATLNTTEISAGLSQSSLGVDKAQRDYDRAMNLYKDSVFTLEQLQNTRTALDVARKGKEAVAFNERYAKIYAASDGFVSKKVANEGEVIGGGMPVLLTNTIQQNASYLLKAGVTDREWSSIKAGQAAKVTLDGFPDQLFEATVYRKLQSADREIGSFQIELKLKLHNVAPPVGMFGKADIEIDEVENAIVIPYNALVEADGKKGYVFTIVGADKVKKIPVNIMKFETDKVYLSDKMDGINQIVISNSAYLNEQSVVKIIK
ncbi:MULTISPECIES: efflux RND transporter periplasmic adaptor subunit [Sphingobacterium]|uniref:Efflux RND transporter periplasmic adaptor subunit n=1 Tax=Sphingobacterium athyrii TaxID=2152717 RepID=A0A363NT70_9SPHI|nr:MULTISPECIES: efflux RND transporter periplasmic adaptor subunit [Sphingobacterium]PUV24012.1 efflux RND transporter periplasmic adaptor subunit [Sphingobacterium athyrii]QIH34219.1 efflux RND transporter periplasmic adaptor subunit [Sphingobacterium sp. DR205]